MCQKTSKVKARKIHLDIVLIPKTMKHKELAEWYREEEQRVTDIDDIRVVSLMDEVFHGRKIVKVYEAIQKLEFTATDLPLVLA